MSFRKIPLKIIKNGGRMNQGIAGRFSTVEIFEKYFLRKSSPVENSQSRSPCAPATVWLPESRNGIKKELKGIRGDDTHPLCGHVPGIAGVPSSVTVVPSSPAPLRCNSGASYCVVFTPCPSTVHRTLSGCPGGEKLSRHSCFASVKKQCLFRRKLWKIIFRSTAKEKQHLPRRSGN